MGLPRSDRVPRVPSYSGNARGFITFTYRAITVYGRTFQIVLLVNSHPTLRPEPLATVVTRFGLVPVRSPLLGESLLLSFPEVT